MSVDTILRINEVMTMVGLRRTTIWGRIREGTFPTAVQLGGSRIGWRESDIRRWIDERPLNQPRAVVFKAAALKQAPPSSVAKSVGRTAASPAPPEPKPPRVSKSTRRDPTDQCSFSFD